MAMKKAELEDHRDAYFKLVDKINSAGSQGAYDKAIKLAVRSWDHVDGMMQYGRRFEKTEFDNISTIEFVLTYSPLVFHFESLDALEKLLKDQRRIDRNTSENLVGKLDRARAQMWKAHRLRNHLERNPKAKEDEVLKTLGGNARDWRIITGKWFELGLLDQASDGDSQCLSLVTRMNDVVLAKCPSCAAVARAQKSNFLAEVTCPKCKKKVRFVIRWQSPGKE